jgi:hypothetical protein
MRKPPQKEQTGNQYKWKKTFIFCHDWILYFIFSFADENAMLNWWR